MLKSTIEIRKRSGSSLGRAAKFSLNISQAAQRKGWLRQELKDGSGNQVEEPVRGLPLSRGGQESNDLEIRRTGSSNVRWRVTK